MSMKYLRKMVFLFCVLIITAAPLSESYALEGVKLVQAGFTLTDPSKEQPKEFITSIPLNTLKGKPVFFVSKIQCDTPECRKQLKSGAVKLIHRWVRTLGTKLSTKQKREFSPDDMKENSVWSAQVIKAAGDWFVEVRTSDDKKLCLEKDKKTSICEFGFQVTLE